MGKYLSEYDNYNLWIWLNHAYDTIHKARQRELNKYNITKGQGKVFSIMQGISGNVTLSLVSRRYFREINTVSEQMSRMEKQGLVRRIKDGRQKNLVRFVLTEKGLQLARKAEERESLKKIMGSLTNEERCQLRSLCKKLRDIALKEIGEQADVEWPL